MTEWFFATGTGTHAMRGKEILQKNGYRASVTKNNRLDGKYGCGYGLVVKTDDPDAVRTLLVHGGVKVLAVMDRKA